MDRNLGKNGVSTGSVTKITVRGIGVLLQGTWTVGGGRGDTHGSVRGYGA